MNDAYSLRLGLGQHDVLAYKPFGKGVELKSIYSFGLTTTFLKPVYYLVVFPGQLQPFEERFDPEKHENHNIYISNIKNKYVMMYRNDRWDLVDRKRTIDDLYENFQEAKQSVLSPDIMTKYLEGKLGYNELLENTVRLFNKFEDSRDLMFKAVEGTLKEKNLLTTKIKSYLDELERFLSIRKNNPLADIGSVKSSITYDPIIALTFFITEGVKEP